jgi:hypothetical protein
MIYPNPKIIFFNHSTMVLLKAQVHSALNVPGILTQVVLYGRSNFQKSKMTDALNQMIKTIF